MCGADFLRLVVAEVFEGSPPRVRSRRNSISVAQQHLGITSACAEQTYRARWSLSISVDHLRVCGADYTYDSMDATSMGSPPRVRSRPHPPRRRSELDGITSACAEQTGLAGWLGCRSGDHLRVCGADGLSLGALRAVPGSPPRVRSRQGRQAGELDGRGITSACAEQTDTRWCWWKAQRDHLRVCGADGDRLALQSIEFGSPPRVRSRRIRWSKCRRWTGITSACAEQTACQPANRQ